MKHSTTCDPWDVVVVPFPFSDRRETKRRPALCLSSRSFNRNGHVILAMITSTARDPWPGDHVIHDFRGAGLQQSCRVRLKIFTIDARLLIRRLGSLGSADRAGVTNALRDSFSVSIQ
jgi:mRNA interferase MazF